MPLDVLLGLQWGDEGKGKIVDVLTPHYDIIARFQGGPNAGHTLEFSGRKHILHLIPSGIFHEGKLNVIGNGVIIDPYILNQEILQLEASGVDTASRLLISRKAHLILPTHRLLDMANELSRGSAKIGSTLKGIGPAYTDKAGRNGLRIGHSRDRDFLNQYRQLKEQHLRLISFYGTDIQEFLIERKFNLEEYESLWFEALARLSNIPMIDSEYFINRAIASGKRVLAEGAQGTLLDIDFGSYPYVTSSNTITAGVCSGLGVAPNAISRIFGIVKAYCTRVGSGPFPTELSDEDGQMLRDQGKEYGSTTGRPRRCGWLDIPALKYAVMINGVTDFFITKADVLSNFREIKVCQSYLVDGTASPDVPFDPVTAEIKPVLRNIEGWNQPLDNINTFDGLPAALKNYLGYIENETGVKISIISTGPDRKDTIIRDNFLHL